MDLTFQQLRKLARISGISIPESELESYKHELNLVFNFLNGLGSNQETESVARSVREYRPCEMHLSELRNDEVIRDTADHLPEDKQVDKGYLVTPEVLGNPGSGNR